MSTKVFIIAEAGVNHNGKLDVALKLVDIAAAAGADAVKFQTFKAEQVVTEKGEMALYQKNNLRKVMSQREMLRQFELREEFYDPIIKHCKKKNILFLSTPHGGKESVDFLESLHIPLYKVGSGDLTNYILLRRIAETKKPIILSSGMATLKEVQDAVLFLNKKGSGPVSVLHCTSNYPCPPEEINLSSMITLMNELDVPVGYSDHSGGIQAAIMAVTLGASIYECHFTLDKKFSGPDHKASADPKELKDRIDVIRKVRIIMGSARKRPTKNEILSMRGIVRKSIVASKDMPKGHTIREDDLEAKRPGDGLSPIHYRTLIGRKISFSLKKDDQILLRYLEKKQ